MTLVYIANSLPFAELPVAMNFPLNQTHRLPAPALLREDPVILHYHDRVDSEGLLLPAPYPLAQARICELNERLRMCEPLRLVAPSPVATLPSPMPFIIGADQFSSLPLARALDCHPELAMLPAISMIPEIVHACQRASCPAERFVEYLTHHGNWQHFGIDRETLHRDVMSLEPFTIGAALRTFYRAYAAQAGKPRFGDPNTLYGLYAEQIQSLLPEARFIHLICDDGDTTLAGWVASANGDSPEEIARHWAANTHAARNQAHALKHYLEVRHEDLVAMPETILQRICAFLDLSWDPDMPMHYKRAAEYPEKEPPIPQPSAVCPALTPSAQAIPAPQSVVCITGMHRSGTSLVGQILHHCGPYLGPYHLLATPFTDNVDGYWEHPHFRKLNDDLLAHFGGGWDAVPNLPAGWEALPEIEPLRQRARMLLAQFDTHPCWGWKDPRTALTMPFWKQLIPNVKVVICVRNPLEVAQSLSQRSMSSLAFGLRLWQAYYEHVLAAVAPEDRIVTHYHSYFVHAVAETKRILDWLALPVSSANLAHICAGASNELRHQRASIADLIACSASVSVLRLYAQLCDEANAADIPAYARSGPQIAMTDASIPSQADDAWIDALLRAQQSELQAELAKSRADIKVLQHVLEAREAELAFLTPTLAARETEIANMIRELTSVRSLVAEREAEVAFLSPALVARETEMTNLVRELASVGGLLVAREAEIVHFSGELAATRAVMQAREIEIADFTQEMASVRGVLAAREAEIASLSRELKAIHARGE